MPSPLRKYHFSICPRIIPLGILFTLALFSANSYACNGIQLISKTSVSCNGGSDGAIDISVVTGTAPYSYSWSNGASTQDVFALSVGTYFVTVTDVLSNSCSRSFFVSEPSPIFISVNITDASCNNSSDGAIDMTPSGGTAPYTYLWSTGATTEDINTVSQGLYPVTVSDFNQCTASQLQQVQAPTLLVTTIFQENDTCPPSNIGSADLVITGGTPPYVYNWLHGPTTEDLSGLGPGTYFVIVSDWRNCQTGDFIDITIGTPTGPPGIFEWTGEINNDWFNICNWSKFDIPGPSDLVIIPGATPTNPLVANDTAYCDEIEIDVNNNGHLFLNSPSGGLLEISP